MPIVYEKFRPIESRFENRNTRAAIAAADVLTTEERAAILRFARAMGIDYGELDVLRDRADGRIYIVDVAWTPFGPPGGLPREDVLPACRTLAKAFESEFLEAK